MTITFRIFHGQSFSTLSLVSYHIYVVFKGIIFCITIVFIVIYMSVFENLAQLINPR